MRIYFLIVLVFAWGTPQAIPQTSSSPDAPAETPPSFSLESPPTTSAGPAAEIVEIIGSKQTVYQIKEQIIQSQLQALEANGIEPGDDESTRSFIRQLDDFMSQHINWETLKPEFVDLYNKTFTPEELNKMLEFYQSPLGLKVLKEWPNVLQQSSAILYGRAQTISPDVKKITQEYIASTRSQPKPAPSEAKPLIPSAPESSTKQPAASDIPELNLE
jgi:hypothetical protein